MLAVLVCLVLGATLLQSAPVNKIGSDPSLWYLAMNLNPSDGHIMDYTTGWARDRFIGTYGGALSKDYLNRYNISRTIVLINYFCTVFSGIKNDGAI